MSLHLTTCVTVALSGRHMYQYLFLNMKRNKTHIGSLTGKEVISDLTLTNAHHNTAPRSHWSLNTPCQVPYSAWPEGGIAQAAWDNNRKECLHILHVCIPT